LALYFEKSTSKRKTQLTSYIKDSKQKQNKNYHVSFTNRFSYSHIARLGTRAPVCHTDSIEPLIEPQKISNLKASKKFKIKYLDVDNCIYYDCAKL
jgi:hypothetical protein